MSPGAPRRRVLGALGTLGLAGAAVLGWWLLAASAVDAERLVDALEAGPRPASDLFSDPWSRICLGTPYMTPRDLVADPGEADSCEGWEQGALGDEGTSLVVLIRDAAGAGTACRVVTFPRSLLLVDAPGCEAFDTARVGLTSSPAGELVLRLDPLARQQD